MKFWTNEFHDLKCLLLKSLGAGFLLFAKQHIFKNTSYKNTEIIQESGA